MRRWVALTLAPQENRLWLCRIRRECRDNWRKGQERPSVKPTTQPGRTKGLAVGRPERPIDKATGSPIKAFATDLRMLRMRSGNPSYREMAKVALFASSVLSSAASGHRLPTLPVTLAFVRACSGDLHEWERRWRALATELGQVPATSGRRLAALAPTVTPWFPTPRPAQLPIESSLFVGHDVELARACLPTAGGAAAIRTPIVISGEIGVGKTAFASRLALELSDQLPDGQLYADLTAWDGTQVDPLEVVAGFLGALGVPRSDIPDNPAHRLGTYRSLLAQRRVLVMLDGACHESHVRPLLARTSHSQIVITSRTRLLGLDVADRIELSPLSREESVMLLGLLVGPHRAAREPEAVHHLAELCGDLPLALTIVGRLTAQQPKSTITRIVADLLAPCLLDHLRLGDISLRGRFASAYEQLSPQAQVALHHVTREHNDGVTPAKLASSMEIAVPSAQNLLEALADSGLLRRARDARRHDVHSLVRSFAAEQRLIGASTTGRAPSDQEVIVQDRVLV